MHPILAVCRSEPEAKIEMQIRTGGSMVAVICWRYLCLADAGSDNSKMDDHLLSHVSLSIRHEVVQFSDVL